MQVMIRLLVLFMISMSVQLVNAAMDRDGSETTESSDSSTATLPPAYPAWPEREARMNIVPPPPSGPYMSTGLARTGRGFACCENNDGISERPQMVNNMPWPERRRPPRRWMPENGEYSFASGEDIEEADRVHSGRYGGQGIPWQPPARPPIYQRPQPGGYR